MPIWRTIPADQQPSLSLHDWSVRKTERQERHFVGYCIENAEARVSSAITSYDPALRRGGTSSGRIYELHGAPGSSSDAEYVWQKWIALNKVERWTNVTREVLDSACGDQGPAC